MDTAKNAVSQRATPVQQLRTAHVSPAIWHNVAVWPTRVVLIEPVGDQLPDAPTWRRVTTAITRQRTVVMAVPTDFWEGIALSSCGANGQSTAGGQIASIGSNQHSISQTASTHGRGHSATDVAMMTAAEYRQRPKLPCLPGQTNDVYEPFRIETT